MSSTAAQSLSEGQTPLDTLSPGTYLLAGPAYTGRRDLALRFVAESADDSTAGLIVSPTDSAETISTRLQTLLADAEERGEPTPDPERVFENYGLVDCHSQQEAAELQHDGIEYAPSPGAITTIGVRLTNQLERLAARDRDAVRLAHLSLSTMLMYTDRETVVKFVSTLRTQVDEFDGTGVLVFNPAMHDDETVETLAQTVDGVIDVPARER